MNFTREIDYGVSLNLKRFFLKSLKMAPKHDLETLQIVDASENTLTVVFT